MLQAGREHKGKGRSRLQPARTQHPWCRRRRVAPKAPRARQAGRGAPGVHGAGVWVVGGGESGQEVGVNVAQQFAKLAAVGGVQAVARHLRRGGGGGW